MNINELIEKGLADARREPALTHQQRHFALSRVCRNDSGAMYAFAAEVLNVKAENDALRTNLIALCDNANSRLAHIDERTVRAVREAANHLGEPFSADKVQRYFAKTRPLIHVLADRVQELVMLYRTHTSGGSSQEAFDRVAAIEAELKERGL